MAFDPKNLTNFIKYIFIFLRFHFDSAILLQYCERAIWLLFELTIIIDGVILIVLYPFVHITYRQSTQNLNRKWCIHAIKTKKTENNV